MTQRLCYVEYEGAVGVAWFTDRPVDGRQVYGDDWNDAPHNCNAGEPYHKFGPFLRLCFEGANLELVGTCDRGGGVGRWGYLSVDQINAGEAPWLAQIRYGAPADGELIPLGVVVPAGISPSDFTLLIREAGGRIYVELKS